jgi:DNA-binding transcriptional LysR family regulator
VDVDLLEGSDLIDALQKGEYNFFFAIQDMIDGVDAYAYQTISQDRLELFVNTEISEAIDLSDWSTVQRHPFVSIQRSDAWLTNKIRIICKNRGITPSIINYYNRAEAAVLAVDSGIGIALLPGKLKHLYRHPNVVTLRIPGDDTEVSFVYVWKNGEKNWASKSFQNIVTDILLQERQR